MKPWKFGDSYWKPSFLGANMLVLGRVTHPMNGDSLNGGTPHFTPQNDHFLAGKTNSCWVPSF